MNFFQTPYNLQIYTLGLQIAGRAIAFDLDGTLVDETLPEPEASSTWFEVKAGAEALLQGLAKNNSLLLYTGRDTSSTAAILRARPALLEPFMPELEEGKYLSEERLLNSPGVFSHGDSQRVVMEILLREDGSRTPFEAQVIQSREEAISRGEDFARDLKLPEFARRRGKRGFEVLVDNSPRVENFLENFGFPVSLLRVPNHRILRPGQTLQGYADDVLFRGAQILAGEEIWEANRKVLRVENVRRLDELVERFEVPL